MPFDQFSWLRLKYGPFKPFLELGKKDYYLERGMWRFGYPCTREQDPMTYDPPVTDSITSPIVDKDSSLEPTMTTAYKYMGMPFEEWRYKVLYRQNPAIKNIYEKWEISDEHPGMYMNVNPRQPYEDIQKQGTHFGLSLRKIVPFGRYFDAPAGEQCFTKGVCCARSMALLVFPFWVTDCLSVTQPNGWTNIGLRYFQMANVPIGASFMWGATTCLVSSSRGTDDLIDSFWGTVAAASVFGLARGPFSFIRAFLLTLTSTWAWRIVRDSAEGTHEVQPRFTTFINDPLSYRNPLCPSVQQVPERNF